MKNRIVKRVAMRLAPAAVLLFAASQLLAQTPAPSPSPTPAAAENFNKTEQMVVMRDGARLHTLIFAPRNATEPLPIIFFRTPYGVTGWGERSINSASLKELVDEGYIFAFQDIRGRYKSEGRRARTPRTRRRLTRARTPTTRLTGWSRTSPATTGASA
jgi:uncharacterized protein